MPFELIKTAFAVTGKLPHTFTADPKISKDFWSVQGIVAALLSVVFYVGISLTFIFLIIGGIKYVMAGGDETKIAEARGAVTNAIIGFIVVIGAFTVRYIVKNLLGITGMPTDILPQF